MVKKELIICLEFLAFFLLCSCQSEKINFVVLKGNLVGETIDSIYLKTTSALNKRIRYAIPLTSKNYFSDTLDIKEGYYDLLIGNRTIDLYLESSFNLTINLDFNTIEEIEFTGIGASENNYLWKKLKVIDKTKRINNYAYYKDLDEQTFLKINDSITSLYQTLLADSKLTNERFVYLENNFILLNKASNLMTYEPHKRLLTNQKEFTVSTTFPDGLEGIDINDEKLLEIPFFIPFLANNDYYFLKNEVNLDISRKYLKCVDCDLDLEYLNYMGNYIKNENIRNATTYLISKWFLSDTEDIDTFYNAFLGFNTNEKYLKSVTELYKNLKTNKSKEILTNAVLKTVNGETITLNDYKGKFLYLDFWASSCKPCIDEFSYFNTLSNEFKNDNIEFIGINIWDTKERWLKTLKKYQLKGNQFTTNDAPAFLESLGINGIPRYIILDDFGNMLDYNAKIPSNSELKIELEKIMN